MYKQPQIYYICPDDLKQIDLFREQVCLNLTNNYYWSDDWSNEFYIQLAIEGFISTSYDTKGGLVLLPEMQFRYAVLDFKDLHISKKVNKLIKNDNYILSLDTKFDEMIDKFDKYHKDNWIKGEYLELIKNLYKNKKSIKSFELISVELNCKQSDNLIAGEIGYIIGKTYTSLSGFSSNEKEYSNYGNLQLVLLSQYLENNDFDFWNLGHPHMEYKQKLGAKIYNRDDFLQKWRYSIDNSK